MAAIGGAAAAVMTIHWWSILVVLPAVVFALAVDPDRPFEQG